jgi:ribosomal protein L4
MKTIKPISIVCSFVSAIVILGGCATTESSVADGQSLKTILAAQVNDAQATARHGTAAPQGTDAEVSNATVKKMRSRSGTGAARPGLIESLPGGTDRN